MSSIPSENDLLTSLFSVMTNSDILGTSRPLNRSGRSFPLQREQPQPTISTHRSIPVEMAVDEKTIYILAETPGAVAGTSPGSIKVDFYNNKITISYMKEQPDYSSRASPVASQAQTSSPPSQTQQGASQAQTSSPPSQGASPAQQGASHQPPHIQSEINYGLYERVVTLPICVTNPKTVTQALENGILKIKINKLVEEENKFTLTLPVTNSRNVGSTSLATSSS